MTKLKKLNIFPLKDDTEFEDICLSLWKRILKDPNTQLNGRRGQRQNGVDLFGRRQKTQDWIGIQCKVRTNGSLSEDDILKDVETAKKFNPKLSELVFATTAHRNANLQTFARELTDKNNKNGEFTVSVFSWDDIQLELSEESNLDICRRFYDDFFVNYEKLGIAISRIMRISIGVGRSTDTQYELLLGKTPSSDNSDSYYGLDYWKGNYFIANWNDKTMDTFPLPTFASDLEQVFRSKRDCYIISKWLTEMKSIDNLLYGDIDEHVKLISHAEYKEFLDSIRD